MTRRAAGIAACVLALAVALQVSPDSPAATSPTRVALAAFSPLPPAAAASPAARAMRNQLLGNRWDDPGSVVLHWVGVSSFIVSIGGHLLLFDAWEIIGVSDGYSPVTRDQLAALDPEAILVGHGHFDHAGDLGLVAGRSGAVVVGSEEICTVAEEGAAREGARLDFTCAITGTMETPDPGVAQSLQLFADLPPVTILQHVHSDTRPPGNGNALDPFVPVGDPSPYLENPNLSPEEIQRFFGQQRESDQGGTWLYHLRIGAFSLLLGDSAGPIFEYPDVRAALDRFPGCVDVFANAILGFDGPVSGLQDPVSYVANTHPRVFVPTHGDAWFPGISAGQEQYRAELLSLVNAVPNPPRVDFLVDPADYLAPRVFRVDDPQWAVPVPGSSCALADAAGGAGAPAGPAAPAPVSETLPATGGAFAAAGVLAVAAGLSARGRWPSRAAQRAGTPRRRAPRRPTA